MFRAKFKDIVDVQKYGIDDKEWGDVVAFETRDQQHFVVVRFKNLEINGLSADLFVFEENEQRPDTADTQA